MDGCLGLEEDWLYGCVVRDVLLSIVDLSSVISLCLAFFFLFLTANNGTAMHQHPQARHREVRDCITLHRIIFRIKKKKQSWNIIRILRLLVSATFKWVTFCDLISSSELCSNPATLFSCSPRLICRSQDTQKKMEGRSPALWLGLSQPGCRLSVCLYVWTFNLVKWVIEHSCRYTKPVG